MNDLDRKLLDAFQRDFPMVPEPYAEIADRLGTDEDTVLQALAGLGDAGVLSRVGAVFRPGAVGHSTLAAMAVPAGRLEEVAELVSGFDAVNHNYEREHRLNLWFVVTARDGDGVEKVLGEIESLTGIKVLDLPMLDDYHLDLGFDLKWT